MIDTCFEGWRSVVLLAVGGFWGFAIGFALCGWLMKTRRLR